MEGKCGIAQKKYNCYIKRIQQRPEEQIIKNYKKIAVAGTRARDIIRGCHKCPQNRMYGNWTFLQVKARTASRNTLSSS